MSAPLDHSDLATRTPELEWAMRSGSDQLPRLEWVDARVDPALAPFRIHPEKGTFRHVPYLALLPTAIGDGAKKAQENGSPTAWEALLMLFARAEWSVAARAWIWAPYSPYPRLLAVLAERWGIGRELHRYRPEVLARLSALLRQWHPRRGELPRARQILVACGEAEQADGASGQGSEVATDRVRNEVFACHPETWWRARAKSGVTPDYRIGDGLMKFQPQTGPVYPIRKEDVVLELDLTEGSKRRLPRELFRLLPVWATFRIIAGGRSS